MGEPRVPRARAEGGANQLSILQTQQLEGWGGAQGGDSRAKAEPRIPRPAAGAPRHTSARLWCSI